ncbi:hypothetical protein JCM9279_005358 [Rhodotorula babjevae]
MVPSREPPSPRQAQPRPSPAPSAASAASPPNGQAQQQPTHHPARPYMPGPPMTSAEKSLFPNSMPVRQLPGIHSFSPSPAPPSSSAAGQAGSPPPPSGASAGAGSPPLQGRRISVGADQKRFASAAASSFGGLPSLPGAGSPSATTSPAPPTARPTPTPPILPPPAKSPSIAPTFRSPFASQAASPPAPSPQPASAQQQQQHKPSAPAAPPSSTSGLLSRSNPMSVSSMLSGPPRAQPISAYSPNPGASTPTSSSAATPQPPVLPPDSRTMAAAAGDHKPPTAPRTQPGATLPAYASSLIAPTAAAAAKPKAAVEQPHQPAAAPSSAPTPTPTAASTAARSSYPPLPSAFARESPYSPAPASSAPPSGTGTPQHAHQHSHQHPQHSQHSQQQQQQATAAALKNSLFPNLGSYRPAGSPTQPPARPQQQQQQTPSSTGTSASTPYQWQAQAAQQAQQVQQQQQAQRFGQQAGAVQAAQQGKGAQPTAPALGAGARPGQPLGQQSAAAAVAPKSAAQPQYQNRFPPTLGAVDSHRMPAQAQQAASTAVPSAAQASASPATTSSQSSFKRRRSDAAEQSQQQQPQRAKPAPSAAAVERAPVSPPEPPAPVNTTPLFTYDEWRKAMVRPPIVEVLNDAVDAWAKKHGSGKADGKRKYLGRVTYDALTPPAELLDGATLAHNVGGYVEVVVPTSWIRGPHASSSDSTKRDESDEIRSSCSVPPVDPHPVALSFGPPSAYRGAPLPLTSPTTPLSLPSHLADLPTVRQRQVWGTDVYTDDSDVLLVLLHSGWLRVTRRDRRLRAGEKGAGADAVRRAKTIGEERIAVPGRDGEGDKDEVPTALLVRLGVVPALVRYEGIERQGIRSRSWGNGHDGVSLRVEDVLSLDDVPPPRATRLRKPRAAACAHQIADLHRSSYPHLHAHDDHDHDDLGPHACPPPPPKRYRFSSRAGADDLEAEAEGSDDDIVVTDTFVLELGEGRGRFVGLDDEDERGEDEEMGDEAAQAMEVEAA